MIKTLAFLAAVLLTVAPAWADSPVPCVRMLGDFWGETPPPTDIKTIDGTSFKSPETLAIAVGEGAVVQGGNFSEWDFRNVALRNACFVDADLKGSVWNGARTPGIGFVRSDLSQSTMTAMRAPHVLFRDSVLTNVKAEKADFSGGLFEGGWFEGSVDGWNIDGANLTDFHFSCGITLSDGCPLYSGDKRMSARGANLTHARLSSFHPYGLMDIELAGATFDRTELSPAQLVSLTAQSLAHPIILIGGDDRVELSPQDAMALIADSTAYTARNDGPSFDCTKAKSEVERLLCSSTAGDLATADRHLGALFAQAGQQPALIAEQRRWLRQRDSCMQEAYPTDCLRTVYHDRIGVLLGKLGERDWLAKGQRALFIDDALPLSDVMRSTALFRRIAPVLARSSMAYVFVARGSDGSYRALGEAVGANAHTCSLDASDLRLDRTNGWYGVAVPGKQQTARILQVAGDELQVFASGRPSGDSIEASLDYMSCGARAAFGRLRRIDLPADLVRQYIDQASSVR